VVTPFFNNAAFKIRIFSCKLPSVNQKLEISTKTPSYIYQNNKIKWNMDKRGWGGKRNGSSKFVGRLRCSVVVLRRDSEKSGGEEFLAAEKEMV